MCNPAATDWATYLSIAANTATILALGYAVYQFRHARSSSSANVAATILTSINTRFEAVAKNQNSPEHYSAVCDLLNELELACAVYFDGQMGGNTGKLSLSLIKDVLRLIEKHKSLLDCAEKAIEKTDTFENIKRFAAKYKKDWRALPRN